MANKIRMVLFTPQIKATYSRFNKNLSADYCEDEKNGCFIRVSSTRQKEDVSVFFINTQLIFLKVEIQNAMNNHKFFKFSLTQRPVSYLLSVIFAFSFNCHLVYACAICCFLFLFGIVAIVNEICTVMRARATNKTMFDSAS